MAFQPLPAYKRLLERERAARTSIDEIELQAMLTEIRRQGYAKVDGQVVPGLAAISVPVFDMQEKLIAVIGVLGRMTDEKFFCQSNIDKVQAAALKASNAMGWQPEEMRGDS